jgi:hypothetical protein
VQHRNSPHNNPSIPFSLNAENQKVAKTIIAKYPPQYKKAAVIPLLEVAQKQNKGWTSISVMNHVAEVLEMPPMRVYEVASFYTMSVPLLFPFLPLVADPCTLSRFNRSVFCGLPTFLPFS